MDGVIDAREEYGYLHCEMSKAIFGQVWRSLTESVIRQCPSRKS